MLWGKKTDKGNSDAFKRCSISVLKEGHSRTILLLLALVVIFGTALRFYHIGRESLWFDELFTADCCSYPTLSQVVFVGNIEDNNPPAHHVVLYYFMKYLGDSEAVARVPSAIAGVGAIVVLFFFGRYLYSSREGLIAAALLAVLWAPVSYSQEARAYSMLLFFSLVTMYLWKKLLDTLDKDQFRYSLIAAYALSAVLCAYTHYFGVFLVALQGVALFLLFARRRKPLIHVVLLYFVVLLAVMPWVPYMKKHAGVSEFWIPRPGLVALADYLKFAFNDSWRLVYAVLPFFAFLMYRMLKMVARRTYLSVRDLLISPDMIVLLWLVVPVAVIFVKSQISMPMFLNRYLIISLPAVYLLFARAITLLPLPAGKQTALAVFMVALGAAHLMVGVRYYREPQKQQWREAVQYILDNDRLPAESVVVGYNHDFRNYYFRRARSDKRIVLAAGSDKDIPKIEAFVASLKPKYIWYLYGHIGPGKKFMRHMTTHYKVVRTKQFSGTGVYLFEK